MAEKSILGNNDIDDVRWLCSLTESELDLLMGLKNLVNMRAKKIGHEALAKKFDLRMMRALSVTFMKHLKEQLKMYQRLQASTGMSGILKSLIIVSSCALDSYALVSGISERFLCLAGACGARVLRTGTISSQKAAADTPGALEDSSSAGMYQTLFDH
ncbi:hypothetical protein Sango_0410800 [Sesamum angolense]|uniref:Uncharacterized protein n=1 Tax=Sesamum angolense TaxID=2727404 RepID=A0AAE1XBC6_9LAMI|nr:hypothetical protein Sango_0410800 [Sesamum angolense]